MPKLDDNQIIIAFHQITTKLAINIFQNGLFSLDAHRTVASYIYFTRTMLERHTVQPLFVFASISIACFIQQILVNLILLYT